MAYEFNGTNQYLSLPTGNVPASARPLTMVAWMYDPSSVASEQSYVSFGRSTTNQPVMRIQQQNTAGGRTLRIQHRTDGGAAVILVYPTQYSLNQWNHVGTTLDNSLRAVWLNGGKSNDNTTTLGTTTIDQFSIGAGFRSTVDSYFIGQLSEVAVWSAYLNADEMVSLSKGFKASRIRPQSLVYYSPLVRTLQDLRDGRPITNNNAATVTDHPRVY